MKKLTTLDTNTVSGGQTEQITVTREASLDNISDKCINTIENTNLLFAPEITKDGFSSKLFVFFDGCAQTEIETIASRIKSAPFLNVSYT